MEPIIRVEKTANTPSIFIDTTRHFCRIEGASFPEDSSETYQSVFDWLNKLGSDFDSELKMEFDFDFLNSISHKKIWIILNKLKKLHQQGKHVKVVWYYDEYDEEIMESGEDLAELINIPFDVIAR